MQPTILRWSITFLFIILYYCLHAQVKTKTYKTALPTALLKGKTKAAKAIDLPLPAEFHRKLLAVKNIDSSRLIPENHFAFPINQQIDLIANAELITDGRTYTYRYTVKAKGALNLSVIFSQFYLPQNAVLTIFTDREITDSITAEQNSEERVWATKVYQGDELYFSLVMLAGEEPPQLVISSINAGYKPYGADFGNIGSAAPCHVNVNCPAGNGWDPEKNSVALIVANGQEACTGALIMNACGQNIPYLLTANHCLAAGNVTSWVFQFQTWSTACNDDIGWIETVQFNGCALRANNAGSDFALLQLNTTPAANSGIHFAGWNRQNNGITSTTVIHHPMGDLMKISRDNGAPVMLFSNNTNVWELQLDIGKVEGGSSGGPYFDQNHRIIGQHFRRPQVNQLPVCDINQLHGGAFASSWTGGGTNATRLSNWLDPRNFGVQTINTTNISAMIQTVSGTLTALNGPTTFCNSATFSTNLPAGTPVRWSVTQPGSTLSCNNCSSVTLTMNSAGSEWITATINPCSVTSQTITKAVRNVNYTTYSNFGVYGPNVFCKNGTGTIGVDQIEYPGLTGFTWALPSGWTKLSGGNGFNTITIRAPNSQLPPTFTLNVTATNVCGGSSTKPHFLAMSNCTSFMLAPNPVNTGTLTVQEIDDITGKVVGQSNIEAIEIMDKMGYVSKRQQFKKGTLSGTVSIAAPFLLNGPHVLRIFDGIEWKTIKFMVNK